MPGSLIANSLIGDGLFGPELKIPFGLLLPFLATAARMGGMFAFVTVPGLRAALDPMRGALVILLALLVFPSAPTGELGPPSLSGALRLAFGEALLGVLFGLTIQVLHEGVLLGAQLLSVQAGYSYASTIDPNSEADSNVIQVFLTLANALLFLTLGLDRALLRVLAESLRSIPPGTLFLRAADGEAVLALTADIFATGLRTAAPVVGLLLMVDVVMALLSRMQPQMQLLQLAFPVKMLAALAVLALLVRSLPGTLERGAERSFGFLEQVVAGGRP